MKNKLIVLMMMLVSLQGLSSESLPKTTAGQNFGWFSTNSLSCVPKSSFDSWELVYTFEDGNVERIYKFRSANECLQIIKSFIENPPRLEEIFSN